MDIRTVKKLIELAKESGVAKLEIEGKEGTVRITNFVTNISNDSESFVSTQITSKSPQDTPKTPQTTLENQPVAEIAAVEQHTIKSPMVGTVYLSPSPGAKTFVEIGQRVKVGDVVCLIEAMKMFNRIEADKDGIIKSILIKNEQPIEYNQALFVIE